MKTIYKTLIIVIALSILAGILAGCSASGKKQQTASAQTNAQTAAAADENTAAQITLKGSSAQITGSGAVYENGNIIISGGGSYSLSGELSEGKITVDAGDEDVTLTLGGVKITSPDSSAINVVSAGTVTLKIADGTENELADAEEYDYGGSYSDKEKEEPDACVFSKSDLILTGGGKLTVNGNYSNAIKSKDSLTIENADLVVNCKNNALTGSDALTVNAGTFDITAGGDGLHSNGDIEINSGSVTVKSEDDGIHADSSVTINGGTFDITAHEGIEGTLVTINDGNVKITASDDGINAAQKTEGITPAVEINGGEITITMGAGDTDAIDSNGNITINGGKTTITAQSGFDYDGKAEINGGEIWLNGTQITEITNQFGGGMRGFGNGGFGGGNLGSRPQGENGGFGKMPPDENGGFAPGGRAPVTEETDGTSAEA